MNSKLFYQQNFLVKKVGNPYFGQSVFFEFSYYCIVSEEELKCEDDIRSFDNIKKFALASFCK